MNRQDLIDRFDQGEHPRLVLYWSPVTPHWGRPGQAAFSQRFLAPFEFEGERYGHVTQFVAAEKARLFGDWATRSRILAERRPRVIKQLERQIRGFDWLVWREYLPETAVRGNLAKFGSRNYLCKYLVSTMGCVLVEANARDKLGGIGLSAGKPDAVVPSRWRGENIHGFALMAARDQLGE
ncbi:NADAR family protein [Actinocrispum sp. NPDC049592]|uniref:NADAR family protein n=1 Tax=Actinocrispum sp. NPDC049592 TaxID=3154835 RepID=UPI003420D191